MRCNGINLYQNNRCRFLAVFCGTFSVHGSGLYDICVHQSHLESAYYNNGDSVLDLDVLKLVNIFGISDPLFKLGVLPPIGIMLLPRDTSTGSNLASGFIVASTFFEIVSKHCHMFTFKDLSQF